MKRVGVMLLFGLLLYVMSACIDSTGNNDDESAVAESGESGENVVNIGFSGPLSGSAAYYGENTLNGLNLAVDEINEEGFEVDGKTYKLNVVALDDAYLPNETASNARRMVQENNTPIIFNPHSGGISAMQVFNEEENFLIGAYSSE